MKRYHKLFPTVRSWTNLLLAAHRARLRKRNRRDVLKFQFELEDQLVALQDELDTDRYLPGNYRTFEIFEPKRRLISAAGYRDRVVHHAICNVIGPLFERRFVFDSYACRKGKGQSLAIQRAQRYSRRFKFCLKTDFRKFFPSIDHQLLLAQINSVIGDKRLLRLIEKIVRKPYPRQSRPSFFEGDDLLTIAHRSCGLPIGNQTSQLFGNVYLDRLDHFIKQSVGIKGYLRYMDDLVLFANSKSELWHGLEQVERFATDLRLRLHPRKTSVAPTRCGFRFLGFQVSPHRIKPFPETVLRFRRRLKRLQKMYEAGEIELHSLRQSVYSYWGYFQIARTPNRFKRILQDFPFYYDLQEMEQSRR